MKKILAILLVIMCLAVFGTNTKAVKADDEYLISSEADLDNWLNDQTVNGKLTRNISLTTIKIIRTDKTLDLNGKKITAVAQIPHDDGREPSTYYYYSMFKVGDFDDYTQITYSAKFIIKNGTLDAGGNPNVEAKDSPLKNRAIMLDHGSLEVDNLTIKNAIIYEEEPKGGPSVNGTAIATSGSNTSTTITNTVIKDCAYGAIEGREWAAEGGAIGNNYNMTLENVKISNCYADGSGGAIHNYNKDDSSLSLTNVEISNCHAGNGGAIYNINANELVLDSSVKIDNCYADEQGGAIYSCGCADGIVLNGAKISNCHAKEGGAIYLDATGQGYSSSSLTINSGTISNCKASMGSAIYGEAGNSGNVKVTLNSGTIKDCEVDNHMTGTIYLKNCSLVMGETEPTGKGIVFKNNLDSKGYINDVSLQDTIITVKSEFETKNKIYIAQYYRDSDTSKIATDDGTEAVEADGYDYTTNPLKNSFASAVAEQYLLVDDNKLVFKVPDGTISVPNFSNGYSAEVKGFEGTPIITSSYQWYASNIIDQARIDNYGSYQFNNHTVEVKDNDANIDELVGVYDQTNKSWSLPYWGYMLRFDGLKPGDTIMYDYNLGLDAKYLYMCLEYRNNYQYVDEDFEIIDLNQSTPIVPNRIVVDIPEEYDQLLFYVDGDADPVTISNLRLIKFGTDFKLAGEKNKKINSPILDKGNYCGATITNDDGVSAILKSGPAIFEGPIKQNISQLQIGTSVKLTMEFEATDDEYTYFTGANGAVYLDGIDDSKKLTKDVDYTVRKGSIIVTVSNDIISKLNAGVHTFFIKKSDVDGDEVAIGNLTITVPEADPEDKSCEKVIGPTWHWNNKKGICEDVGVVRTNTR